MQRLRFTAFNAETSFLVCICPVAGITGSCFLMSYYNKEDDSLQQCSSSALL